MRLINCISIALTVLCLFSFFEGQSQTDTISITAYTNYQEPVDYEIGGLKIIGAEWADHSALLNIAGLKVGDKVRIPGPRISQALKSLWKLGLFEDVNIYLEKNIGEIVYLIIEVEELSRLGKVSFKGVKKSKIEELRTLVQAHLQAGRKITDYSKNNALQALNEYYKNAGYSDVQITVKAIKNKQKAKSINTLDLQFIVEKNSKVKIEKIDFSGNHLLKERKLRKLLGLKTKGKLFANSKFIHSELEDGKQQIINRYQSLGFLDAKITKDSIWRNRDGLWQLLLTIEEGNPYYFGTINWSGNSIYTSEQLSRVLGIQKGAIFSQALLDSRLQFSQEGNDVSGLYMDHGYLFFRAEAVQHSLRHDTIDLVINILEGPQATINKVVIKGNDRTHDHVVRRELRTKPGQKFSRADLIRSQRALMSMGYFNPESMDTNTPVNPKTGTVDIEYVLEEKSNDQFELAGGWGGAQIGFTGSVGITLNNFSLKEFLTRPIWKGLPVGDGQRTSIRFQSNGKAYQSLNFSFTEPWLGGKRPNSLTAGFFYTRYFNDNNFDATRDGIFNLFGGNISWGQRLTWPDDNIIATTSVHYQKYHLQNWTSGFFTTDQGNTITDGTFHNLSLSQTFARSTINHSIFPTEGARISLSLQATLPYSLFSNKEIEPKSTEQFKWLEYHKWRLNAEWYTSLGDKLVLKTAAKFGFLGTYNQDLGISPFERFQIGGDGLNNLQNSFTGTDIISLRGYEVEDLENNFANGRTVATPIFNKFTMELRYPLSTNPNAMIYGLAFVEAGNAYQSFRDYNPLDVKRSVGIGLRAHLPMFGALGFDYGLGFDKTGEQTWQNFAKFSVVLGFEPE